jgi:hypothetical protein
MPINIFTQVENNTVEKSFYKVSPGYQLCKGSKRIVIINPTASEEPLDVTLHQQEAYVKPSLIDFEQDSITGKQITMLSSSYNHDLAIIKLNRLKNENNQC